MSDYFGYMVPAYTGDPPAGCTLQYKTPFYHNCRNPDSIKLRKLDHVRGKGSKAEWEPKTNPADGWIKAETNMPYGVAWIRRPGWDHAAAVDESFWKTNLGWAPTDSKHAEFEVFCDHLEHATGQFKHWDRAFSGSSAFLHWTVGNDHKLAEDFWAGSSGDIVRVKWAPTDVLGSGGDIELMSYKCQDGMLPSSKGGKGLAAAPGGQEGCC